MNLRPTKCVLFLPFEYSVGGGLHDILVCQFLLDWFTYVTKWNEKERCGIVYWIEIVLIETRLDKKINWMLVTLFWDVYNILECVLIHRLFFYFYNQDDAVLGSYEIYFRYRIKWLLFQLLFWAINDNKCSSKSSFACVFWVNKLPDS